LEDWGEALESVLHSKPNNSEPSVPPPASAMASANIHTGIVNNKTSVRAHSSNYAREKLLRINR